MSGQTGALAVVAGVFVALYAAHMVGDHWVQTDHQAQAKAGPGWRGRWADVRHVATLTLTKIAALAALGTVTGWRPHPGSLAVALTVDAVSHWWADRRHTLVRLAAVVERCGINGKTGFLALGTPRPDRDDNPSLGTGAYALDQSWHIAWLFVAALIVGAG